MTASLALETAALVSLAAAVAVGMAIVVRGAARLRQPASATSSGPMVLAVTIRFEDLPHRLIQLATLLLLGSMASLAVLAGRAPWANLAETATAFAAAMLAAYLLVERQTHV